MSTEVVPGRRKQETTCDTARSSSHKKRSIYIHITCTLARVYVKGIMVGIDYAIVALLLARVKTRVFFHSFFSRSFVTTQINKNKKMYTK